MSWKLVYTRQALKDAKKLSASGLRPNAERLLAIIARKSLRESAAVRNAGRGLEGSDFAADQHSASIDLSGAEVLEDGEGPSALDTLRMNIGFIFRSYKFPAIVKATYQMCQETDEEKWDE